MIESVQPFSPDIPFGPDDVPWQKTFSRLQVLSEPPRVSPPSGNPRTSYAVVPEVPYAMVQLSPCGLDEEQYRAAESRFRTYLEQQSSQAVGYQLTSNLDYGERLSHYLDQHLNNVGDPYQSGAYTPNSKVLERAILDYYASLWNAKWPHDPADPSSYWGYLLTMGSSEGNIYGLWSAREFLSGKLLRFEPAAGERSPRIVYAQADRRTEQSRNAYHPVAFFSQDTHYSLVKAVRVLGIDTFHAIGSTRYPDENPLGPGTPWPEMVPSVGGMDGTGSIDVGKLATLVRFFASKGHPIIVNLNYGSTFKGAYDDVAEAAAAVHHICARYGLDERRVYHSQSPDSGYDVRPGYWIHVDGALGAAYAPYLQMARDAGLTATAPPVFDFRVPYVHSITMSGHKWLSAPWPCGVFMTRTGLQMAPPASSEYIGTADTTFAGSRNGFSAVLMWDYLARHSYDDQIRMAIQTDRMAAYAHDQLLAVQRDTGQDLRVARSPLSLTVRFRRPNPDIVRRYSLSYETLTIDGRELPYAHLYAMKHVSRSLVDKLAAELRRPGAFGEAA